jgi:hypothetical protein
VTTPPPTGCPRCAARWPRPGPCDWCAARLPPEPLDPSEVASFARVIPRMFRDVSWSVLADLRTEHGEPRVCLSGEGLGKVRERLAKHRRAVVLGPAGAGKTTLAAAYARNAIEAGCDRVRWFHALQLADNAPREGRTPGARPVTPAELASTAGVLVLDDLGAELEGAQPKSGLLAQRVGPCSRIIAARFDSQRPTLVTTGFEPAFLGELYGDGIARRLFEGATIVRLGGA